jgi:hypothetical protein
MAVNEGAPSGILDCVNELRLTLLMNFGSPSAICLLLKPLGRSAASSVLQDRA